MPIILLEEKKVIILKNKPEICIATKWNEINSTGSKRRYIEHY